MTSASERWKEITRSEFPWEQEALAFVRERLPDREPYRAWANFEFVADDGSINEVDLLVLSPRGFFLVEIKSRPGTVTGDMGTWMWLHEGRRVSVDNPLLLANRKAKRLVTLLRRQKACAKIRTPFLQPLVFLSAPHLDCQLDAAARQGVHVRDVEDAPDRPGRAGIIAALAQGRTEGDGREVCVDAPMARALSRAMEEAGIRPAHAQRRVGDYVLARLLFEGPGYQDWEARHAALPRVVRRVRVYLVARGTSPEARRTLVRAAEREFQILEGIQHPGILRAIGYHEYDLGPALAFEHDPRAMRLDHYLLHHGQRLDVDRRLGLLRQIAEAVRHAHERKLVHRALSPQSVLVEVVDAAVPRALVFNWQTGARDFGTSSSHSPAATLHLGELVEEAARPYMAPEAFTSPGSGEQLDVFGLGAIAYHLFAGEPPASSFLELTERLREGKGLQIASVLNGAGEHLRFLIQYSTHPEVTSRLDAVADFLDYLERVEEELTAPAEERARRDPTEATVGDRLEGGFEVRKRLGKGSTAVAFLVARGGREQVLKLALDPGQNERLLGEAEVLRELRHPHIVEVVETVRVGDRVGLLTAKAGEETLAQRLRTDGRLHVDLLQRFGEDLLDAVRWLEAKGIPHRDIKPDNIAIAPIGPSDRLHLVLFDFSLSRTSAERIRAGTVPYLDPFLSLRRPARWDLHAERFAAAMTLYEMATGAIPRWGDGKSAPAVLDCEVTLDTELFEADVREPLTAFFGKALRRGIRERFDNAEEMLRAWRQAFERIDRPAITTDHEGEVDLGGAVASATLDSPLAALGLTTRAINALERAGALEVRALLRLPVAGLSHMRGVGNKTRRELLKARQMLVARFPIDPVEPDAAPDEAEGTEPRVSSVDLLARQIVPVEGESTEPRVLRALLALGELPAAGQGWPSQAEIAEVHKVTRARVGQILAKARERWSRNPSLTGARDEIVEILRGEGGVVTAGELAAALLATRGSAQEEPLRTRLAGAVARATSEAERTRANPRWVMRRVDHAVLIALNQGVDGQRLADYAERLGGVAERLATTDPLPSPARVLEELQGVPVPEGWAMPAPARLVRLAAAASRQAAVSSRLADRVRADSEFMQVAELYRGRADFDLTALVTDLVEAGGVPFLPVLRYTPSGMRTRAAWEECWALQRREDAGEQVGEIPVPPKYATADFRKSTYWRLRGKLDVPKERFVLYPLAERDGDRTAVLGWAGWDALQQAQALATYLIDVKESEGWPVPRLAPLLAGLLALLPWLRQWHNDLDPATGLRMGDYFAQFLDEEARTLGLTPDDLRAWAPPAFGHQSRRKRTRG